MGFNKPADEVVFAELSLERAFLQLSDKSPLKKSIRKAIDKLKVDAACGEKIKRELIPKEYIKNYKINNLWWYPLADAWRLVYSLSSNEEVKILAIIIEFFNHKEYERRFGYG